jgi:hypothetical protein
MGCHIRQLHDLTGATASQLRGRLRGSDKKYIIASLVAKYYWDSSMPDDGLISNQGEQIKILKSLGFKVAGGQFKNPGSGNTVVVLYRKPLK